MRGFLLIALLTVAGAESQAFASAQRTMTSASKCAIARAMTPREIEEAAAYYASQPSEIVKSTD
jgi:hypothetical protein